MQQALKPLSGATWTQIVASQLLDQLDIAVDEAAAALHAGFGRI
jgi:hypothetical protein